MQEANPATVEQEIAKTLEATGLPATPPAEDHTYGQPNGDRVAMDTTAAIERVCEAAIDGFYAVADEADRQAKGVRDVADKLAERLRAVSKGHAHEVAEFLVFCRQAQTAMEQHAADFEAKVGVRMDGRH